MDELRVRVYNVRFGDAVLISVPERAGDSGTETRHVLIDFGNAPSGEGGDDAVFQPVFENILHVLDGRPLDLYVMTHEHLDHVQGLPYMQKQLLGEDLRQKLQVRHAWLTASAEDDYYERHPEAKKFWEEAKKAYSDVRSFSEVSADRRPFMNALLANNDRSRTDDCVSFLKRLTTNTWYVHRGLDLEEKHLFREARLAIWAPEEDTSVYYGRFHPMVLGVRLSETPGRNPTLTLPKPPPGVDGGAFYNLVDIRRQGYLDNLLAIDAAANNTSVVLSLEWRGWRLLFAGDAEVRSWKTMYKQHQLAPFLKDVHFLKVSHHGSCSGMPPAKVLDCILPETPNDDRPRRAVVSTYPGTYSNVPDEETLSQLARRCEVYSTTDLTDGAWIDVSFPG